MAKFGFARIGFNLRIVVFLLLVGLVLGGCASGSPAQPKRSNGPATRNADETATPTSASSSSLESRMFAQNEIISVADFFKTAGRDPLVVKDDLLVNRVVNGSRDVILPPLKEEYSELVIYITCSGERSFDVSIWDAKGRRVRGFGGNNCGGPHRTAGGEPIPKLAAGSIKVIISPSSIYTISVFGKRSNGSPAKDSGRKRH